MAGTGDGVKAGYDARQEDIKKFNTALAAAGARSVHTASGNHPGRLKSNTGGIYAGAVHLISDCETTTTSATSRGVWSAKTALSTLSAADTWNKTGTNSIKVVAGASAAVGDGAVFTCTTNYELDLSKMGYVGFWFTMNDNINVFDADADLTVYMYQSSTLVYKYEVPAYVAQTPHGKLPKAASTGWYIECPITSSQIQTGQAMSKITSIEILKTTTAMNNTKYYCIDYFEAYEISAGGCPFRWGQIIPMTDSGSGITRGDWVEISDVTTKKVKTASTNDATLVVGKAVATAAADATVYVLTFGPRIGFLNETSAAGKLLGLADAANCLLDDTGAGTVQGQAVAKSLEAGAAQYDMINILVQPMSGSDGS